MGLLTWIVFGALAGWVASLLTGKKHGCLLNILIGVIGAFMGGMISHLFLGEGLNLRFNISSFAIAVIGSVILLILVRCASK
ncbi:GlsB/YeaQ/YmgE family stress response membrane protein [bacterium]|nr:GlsB/YeaQ/YmgE family stress response membrane protein [bacterium]